MALLARGLALLVGVMVGARAFAEGWSPLASAAAGLGAFALVTLTFRLVLRRYARLAAMHESEEPPEGSGLPPLPSRPPTPRARPRRTGRRVLTGSGETEDGEGSGPPG